mmetsp:Transcript_92704/g.299926  ORF Transcript_92704/g.299926 Transcript_92704/m.299926 type:complete len:318 (-) Transcript_92704:340-1293(-)
MQQQQLARHPNIDDEWKRAVLRMAKGGRTAALCRSLQTRFLESSAAIPRLRQSRGTFPEKTSRQGWNTDSSPVHSRIGECTPIIWGCIPIYCGTHLARDPNIDDEWARAVLRMAKGGLVPQPSVAIPRFFGRDPSAQAGSGDNSTNTKHDWDETQSRKPSKAPRPCENCGPPIKSQMITNGRGSAAALLPPCRWLAQLKASTFVTLGHCTAIQPMRPRSSAPARARAARTASAAPAPRRHRERPGAGLPPGGAPGICRRRPSGAARRAAPRPAPRCPHRRKRRRRRRWRRRRSRGSSPGAWAAAGPPSLHDARSAWT